MESNEDILKAESEAAEAPAAEPATIGGQLIRIANPATSVTGDGGGRRSPKKLNIENIIQKDGLEVYKDQAGQDWLPTGSSEGNLIVLKLSLKKA